MRERAFPMVHSCNVWVGRGHGFLAKFLHQSCIEDTLISGLSPIRNHSQRIAKSPHCVELSRTSHAKPGWARKVAAQGCVKE